MPTILIPVDFSNCSINALRYGLNHAQKLGPKSEIVIVHGYQIPIPAAEFSLSMSGGILDEFKNDAEEKFEKLRNDLIELDNYKIKYDIKPAFALDAILNGIKEENPDLVIMGTKGSSGLSEVLFGSNTTGVIKSSVVPVIAVPEVFKTSNISKITLAIDEKLITDFSTLKMLAEIASIYKAHVDIVHIGRPEDIPKTELLKLTENFHGLDPEFHFFGSDDISDEIEEFVYESESDLLVMIPRKHTIFEKLFSGSLTAKLAHHTRIPLMAIPA